MKTVFYGYETVRDPTTGMAEISAIADWVRAFLLSERQILASHSEVEEFLSEMRRSNPSNVRYHVDGKGRIAYVILRR